MDTFEATENNSDQPEPEPPLRILIADEQSTLAVDEARVRSAVRSVLDGSSYRTGLISVAVVDDATIHALNRQYLHHDYPTDVLSFVLDRAETHLEGELILGAETAAREASDYGWAPVDELMLYAVHGTLHLVGYCDKDAADEAAMHAAEADHLRMLGISLPENQDRWRTTATAFDSQSGVPKS